MYLIGYTGSDTELTLPNDYNGRSYEIGSYAFYESKITSLVIGNNVTAINSYAFSKCKSLTKATIGESVEKIGNSAFRECQKLTSIIIPVSVKQISAYAFTSCNLSSIKYRGSSWQWSSISKSTYWTNNSSYKMTYNYTGE